ncbi:hypothetical protein GQ53DRAFT_431110 [Thozetella sp. PMI_491]|nr:hypothetical protein GQ53DRAFT_431110 [Thozetella sp. PMI_491]
MADAAGNDSPDRGSTTTPDAINSWWSCPPPVSRKLLAKASDENKSLTPTERLYLLSLLDLPGKALAHPDSLTAEERDILLGRPSPAILESILRRFFPVPSAEAPADADADAGHRDTGVDGQQETYERVQERPGHCRSIPEVVAAYGQPAQMAKLSLAAQECVSLNWWTLQYERALRPWEDRDNADNAGTAAAELMSRHVRPEELAFEDAVRALWCRPENACKLGIDHFEELDDTDANPDEAEQIERWAAEASRLREELRAQVAAQLAELSGEDREALLQLRERIEADAAQDAEEDARKKEAEEEEGRKRRAELAEEKRAKRARRARKGLVEEDKDSDEDSDEEGWIMGSVP